MTITPDDTIDPTPDETILQSQIEEIIDAELLLIYEDEHTASVRHALIYQIFEQNPRLLRSILATYEAAGWRIVLYENCKQGPWLSFSRAPG